LEERAIIMNIEQLEHQALPISREKFLALVSEMLSGARGGREDDDHPLPPGPWDPVIREALERAFVFGPLPEPWRVFGPHPEPRRPEGFRTNWGWKGFLASILARHPEIYDAIGGGHNPLEEVALNPQPLPPLPAFLVTLAQTVIARAELLHEIAGAALREGERQGIIVVGGYINRFSEDVCGNGFRLRWPFPGPRPHWFKQELRGIDLVVLAAQFEQGAREAYSPELGRAFSHASGQLVEAGLSRME
jgi:hypothetical protein